MRYISTCKILLRPLAIVGMLALGMQAAVAMPAKNTVETGRMTDGTPVEAIQYGDEYFHFYVSQPDGNLLIKRGETFVNADIDTDGKLIEATAPRKAEERLKERAKLPASSAPRHGRQIPGLVPNATFPTKGEQKVAVILVEYQDVKFNLDDPLDYFTRMLNEEGFSDYRATGSARDWYVHSSNGQFLPEFVVMGPVTLQKNREYYGGNDAWGQDSAPQKMAIEACRSLNAEVNFAEFDRDNDGYIDNVFIVYAGRGEASGGSSDCVWPHAWTISGAEPGSNYTFDGVRLNRYACTNEWELSDLGYGFRPVGIGSFVHEFSHVMGLPDLYSTTYASGSFTAGAWSVMDYGPYNNDMCTPPQFSAWERASLGYMEIDNLDPTSANVAIAELGSGSRIEAYMVPTEKNNEFFVLENRQQNGWDAYIPGHGMLVWHIDYDGDTWASNSANNDNSHNCIDIVEADNVKSEATRSGDAFPGTSNVTEFSENTDPAFKSWSGRSLGLSLTDIAEIDTRLVFRVNGGQPDIATPVLKEVTEIGPAGFTVNWLPVEGAEGYRLTISEAQGEEVKEFYADAACEAFRFTDLEPETEYRYTLRADDGCYGSAPTESRRVVTAEPTFDYFTPVALEATEIKDTSFKANWEAMEGAEKYYINLFELNSSEPVTVTEDFSGDIENLPSGFTSSSRATYGMASYSGEAIPALRLSLDGDELMIANPEGFVENLEFWHRGNGTTEEERILVEGYDGEGWNLIESIPVFTEKGGSIERLAFEPFLWDRVRIRFSRPAKGAVAIDDVKAVFTLPQDDALRQLEASAGATTLLIDHLTPSKTYKYSVTAWNGEYRSRESSRIQVVTRSAGAGVAGTESPAIRIEGYTVRASERIKVYDAMGRLVAEGAPSVQVPGPGIYIVITQGGGAVKIFIK